MRALLATLALVSVAGCGIAEHRERHDACVRAGGQVRELSESFACINGDDVADEWGKW